MAGWIAENWFNILSAAGIIGSLLFTAVSLRSETKTRRISNLLALTQNHREMWAELFEHPDLGRVLDPAADLSTRPITTEEHFFITMAIQHLNSAYQAMKSDLVMNTVGVRQDVRTFFSLPVPLGVWKELRALQSPDFVEFVEQCLIKRELKD